MKKLVIISSLIILVMGLFLGSCGEDETKPMTIKLGYDTPPTTNIGVPAEYFAEEVTKRTEGRITVETYPVGTLSTQASSLESLRAGVADAYLVSINSNLDAFPITSFTGLPGLDFFPYTKEKMKIEVDTITIDGFCTQENIRRIDILKLDVEGAEIRALKAAHNILSDRAVTLIYTEVMFIPHYEGGCLFHEVAGWLKRYEYALFNLYNLKRARNGQLRWGNAIFLSPQARTIVESGHSLTTTGL